MEYPSGEKLQYPALRYVQQEASVDYCNKLAGVEESAESMCKLLTSMSLNAKPNGEGKIVVDVPPTRQVPRKRSLQGLNSSHVNRFVFTNMFSVLVICFFFHWKT